MSQKNNRQPGDKIDIKIGGNATNVAVGKHIQQTINGEWQREVSQASSTLQQLEQNYEQARQEAQRLSNYTSAASWLAYAIVLAGAIMFLYGKTSAGIATGVLSLLAKAIGLFFNGRAQNAYKRLDAHHKELIAQSRYEQAIQLCDSLEEGGEKEKLKQTIAKLGVGIKQKS